MAVRNKIKLLSLLCLLNTACKHKPGKIEIGGYPADVAHIVINKCATSGCHNDASYKAAGGLNLTTWNNLFYGGNSGAVTIPYRPDFSTLCFYTNIYTDLGVTLQPTMPLDQTPLTREEYLIIKDWIQAGAPNSSGNIKFADNLNRSKIYVTNRMCDVVTVFDASTKLQMRYIDVGNRPAQEFPYSVQVAPDKKHWYVSFFAYSNMVQKFDATNDKPAGEINLGNGSWLSFAITSDSRYGYFVSNDAIGKIVYADLQEMKVLATYTFNNNLKYPVGAALCEAANKLYVGAMSGNFIYSIDITDPLSPVIKELPIDGSATPQYHTLLDPSDLCMDPTGYTCYVACVNSMEVIAMDMQTDAIIKRIPVGASPTFMSYSPVVKKLFITCADDTVSFPGNRGSVVVIDVPAHTITKKINCGFQPYGIAVNEPHRYVAVANANLRPDGNAPHHVSGCGGRNGNVSFIDLNTLELITNKRSEVAVFPHGVASR